MNLYQKQFNIRQGTPAYWHNKSHDLFISARMLWTAMQNNKNLEVNCLATYKMLMGMSFELLFKSHCVGAGISFGATHDLVKLVKAANLLTSKDENRIFEILAEYVIWDGRYPAPKKFQYLESHWKSQMRVLNSKKKLGDLTLTVQNNKLDFENLLPLWRKFSDLFMEKYN